MYAGKHKRNYRKVPISLIKAILILHVIEISLRFLYSRFMCFSFKQLPVLNIITSHILSMKLENQKSRRSPCQRIREQNNRYIHGIVILNYFTIIFQNVSL